MFGEGGFTREESQTLSELHIPISLNEAKRVHALRSSKALEIDDMDEKYVRIVNMAARVLKVSIVTLHMIEVDTMWIKARVNFSMPIFPRDYALCNFVIIDDGPSVLVVNDTHRVDTYRSYPFVAEPPYVRFYAGAPQGA